MSYFVDHPFCLSEQQNQIQALFDNQGFIFCDKLLSQAQVNFTLNAVEKLCQRVGDDGRNSHLKQTHLSIYPIFEAVSNLQVLDYVQRVSGKSSIYLWATSIFIKPPFSQTFFPWHQDGLTWNSDKIFSVWIALTRADENNGGLKFIPSSHKYRFEHQYTYDTQIPLSKGQTIRNQVDESTAVTTVLEAGDGIVYHALAVHSSPPNSSPQPRIGLVARYIVTEEVAVLSDSPIIPLKESSSQLKCFVKPPAKIPLDKAIEEHLKRKITPPHTAAAHY